MIHVALTCTRSTRYNGDPCTEFHATIDPAEAEAWYRRTITENAWTEEDRKPYCPRHDPADCGAVIQVKHGDDYEPIGDSGWEMRLPRDGSSIGHARVEVRQTRKDGRR